MEEITIQNLKLQSHVLLSHSKYQEHTTETITFVPYFDAKNDLKLEKQFYNLETILHANTFFEDNRYD